jgi:hypothetical protein
MYKTTREYRSKLKAFLSIPETYLILSIPLGLTFSSLLQIFGGLEE